MGFSDVRFIALLYFFSLHVKAIQQCSTIYRMFAISTNLNLVRKFVDVFVAMFFCDMRKSQIYGAICKGHKQINHILNKYLISDIKFLRFRQPFIIGNTTSLLKCIMSTLFILPSKKWHILKNVGDLPSSQQCIGILHALRNSQPFNTN